MIRQAVSAAVVLIRRVSLLARQWAAITRNEEGEIIPEREIQGARQSSELGQLWKGLTPVLPTPPLP